MGTLDKTAYAYQFNFRWKIDGRNYLKNFEGDFQAGQRYYDENKDKVPFLTGECFTKSTGMLSKRYGVTSRAMPKVVGTGPMPHIDANAVA